MLNFQEWLNLLRDQVVHIDIIQCAVLVLGVTEVLLARANKIWLYPAGIAATTLSVYSLFNAQLYAESLLNLYYLVMSIYGWWYWLKKKHKPPVQISCTSNQEWVTVISFVIIGYLILYGLLRYFTPSTVPHWDALVTSTAWVGMWLLARRKLENWILLNLSNVVAIPLLFHKGLPLYGLLTIFLFAVAVQGYFSWRKKLNDETIQFTG